VTTLTNEVINVEGMSCDHCKHSIEKALNGLDGVTFFRSKLGEWECGS
jgi:copper chaperone CopZ